MNLNFDPGSFKDPDGRIFEHQGSIYRTLSPGAVARMRACLADGTLGALIDQELLIESTLISTAEIGLADAGLGETVMQHARIPVLTYPSEWSFDMLRDAALVTLDLLQQCLDRDLMLKDATAFNVAFHDGRMQFFDTLSIDDYVEGAPWDGYAQFCREFLFPLMLTSYRGIEFQPWLRGSLSGIPVRAFARLLSLREKFRGPVLKHVVLQAKLDRSFADTDTEMRSSFKTMKFSKPMIAGNVAGLSKTLRKLGYEAGDSVWGDYASSHSYSAEDETTKRQFVDQAVDHLSPSTIVDLGGNIGDYSLLVAPKVDRVLCVDIDPACINTLYRRIRDGGPGNVIPIVGDLLNPTPALGWNLTERRDLFERIRSESFFALALVHHLAIGGNVPLPRVVETLHRIAPSGVVEWVDKQDAMVQRMLRNRTDVFEDYTWDVFRLELERRFNIVKTVETHNGARRLCLLEPR
ncbi:MAG: class I SAM-dependent methyltransferase [Rhodospirillaceae bacterium]|nr:class I SAM-dependent methyltransferase [Rhodospirillaceae bacterium]